MPVSSYPPFSTPHIPRKGPSLPRNVRCCIHGPLSDVNITSVLLVSSSSSSFRITSPTDQSVSSTASPNAPRRELPRNFSPEYCLPAPGMVTCTCELARTSKNGLPSPCASSMNSTASSTYRSVTVLMFTGCSTTSRSRSSGMYGHHWGARKVAFAVEPMSMEYGTPK